MVARCGVDYPDATQGIGTTATHMESTRIIECIGASDEDVAHLRLLLRSAAPNLLDSWRWGHESRADLVIVDAGNLIGDSALRRIELSGVACAQLIEADADAPDGLCLRKPLRREAFVALLNGLAKSTIAPLTIMAQGADFFDIDLGESDGAEALPALDLDLGRNKMERELDDFEAMFKRDPLAETSHFVIPEKLSLDAGVEYIADTTVRSAQRAGDADPFMTEGLSIDSIDPSFRYEGFVQTEEAFPLSAYLDGRMLGGTARITLPGAPTLVLDPKERVFHAQGKLRALEIYCREPLRLDAWERLVNSELFALRERIPARPYLRLQWLGAFIASGGYLAKHLDPGGSYRLIRWLELAQDYPRAFRVGSNMIVPQNLADIARASEVSMAEVFDVVNAYDAIGYLVWTRREIKQW